MRRPPRGQCPSSGAKHTCHALKSSSQNLLPQLHAVPEALILSPKKHLPAGILTKNIQLLLYLMNYIIKPRTPQQISPFRLRVSFPLSPSPSSPKQTPSSAMRIDRCTSQQQSLSQKISALFARAYFIKMNIILN